MRREEVRDFPTCIRVQATVPSCDSPALAPPGAQRMGKGLQPGVRIGKGCVTEGVGEE